MTLLYLLACDSKAIPRLLSINKCLVENRARYCVPYDDARGRGGWADHARRHIVELLLRPVQGSAILFSFLSEDEPTTSVFWRMDYFLIYTTAHANTETAHDFNGFLGKQYSGLNSIS